MNTEFSLRVPDEARATVTITATVGELKQLRKQLANEWPSWDFARQLGDVIRQAEERFSTSQDSQP